MAPIKFEEQLKDKLEKRTLSPSSESWAKLSSRLDEDDKNSKNPVFWWLGIAAGIIIMIAVSIQFFKTGDAIKVMPQLVEEPVETIKIKDKNQQVQPVKSIELANDEDAIDQKTDESEANKEAQILEYKNVIKSQTKTNRQLVEQTIKNTDNNKTESVANINLEQVFKSGDPINKDAIANAISNLKSENASIMDKEVDSLLKLASKELLKDKLQKEATKTVDADALLMRVEDEMGQSFRSKVFEAIKDSFETVKTAVAERKN